MRRWLAVFVGAIALALPRVARAEGDAATRVSVRKAGPCSQCITSLPEGTDPRPLLVLLHGDGEPASLMYEAWGHAAEARGFAVLAAQCPTVKGCKAQSWWRWDGDPSWLVEQADAVGKLRAIDGDRRWIVGWSGGGSYIGYRTQDIERDFAAIVIHGGGMPPADPACPTTPTGVYFVVGDANPLHALASRLRDHYERCQDDVVWTLLSHADHQGEWRGLASHREAILDWLATRRLSHDVPDASTGVAGDADAAVLAPLAVAHADLTPASRSFCSASDRPLPEGDLAASLILTSGALLALRRRRAA